MKRSDAYYRKLRDQVAAQLFASDEAQSYHHEPKYCIERADFFIKELRKEHRQERSQKG